MRANQRELDALEAYLRLLQRQGADADNLNQRRALAMRLIPSLAQQLPDGNRYRECAELALQQIEKTQWPAFLAVAREYYHFWTNDIKAIAALHASGGYDPAPALVAVSTDALKSLWENLERERFGITETWPLQAYVAALREAGADKSVVETRSRLVKLLLVRLRGAEDKSPRHYHAVVDSLLPLFELWETRALFLAVAREFFYFWDGHPEASSRIVLDAAALP